MFNELIAPGQDPILALTVAFRADQRPDKVDLGIGVYRNSAGETPVMQAVRRAAMDLAETQPTKSYVGLAGDERFNQAMTDLLLAGTAGHARAAAVQTPGASGALRMLAELIATARPSATVWISRPSYVNHKPVMESAGLAVREYPYFNVDTKQVDEQAMLAQIAQLGPDDVLLLHGCCHNPTGGDISAASWQRITELALERGFLPFVDIAYQGFGDGLQEDAAGLRRLADAVPEMVIATSCSKNFGLYRERTGAAIVIGESAAAAAKAKAHIQRLARGTYTMPPDHGAAIVARILHDDELRQLWQDELTAMNERINQLRAELVQQFRAVAQSDRFDYFGQHRGMFSVTGLSAEQLARLKTDHGIYVVDGGRVNVAGLSEAAIPTVVKGFLAVGA
ncbi:aspartate/tyrosine/aromatic aminotransferase [Natronospirillum operosum]|uniref:Aspartate/tyrosine/aromatic aminotransferase n=1 Tax=Natronospirillum operosum TaxID=2759953 RepID=A0A4Z0WG46_9GAMM|nr:amino acid aminotransferase [Natronospirillum operosum]TGG93548.1 aspartate/tyrosine/aromatic aminotransferase [Natronospirillum operosum]